MCLLRVTPKRATVLMDFMREEGEDGYLVAYKVVTLDDKSPFSAGCGYEWKEGKNTSSYIGSPDYLEADQPRIPMSHHDGFHCVIHKDDAVSLCKELSTTNQWSRHGMDLDTIYGEAYGYRQEIYPIVYVSHKVIMVKFKPKDVIACGTFGLVAASVDGCVINELETTLEPLYLLKYDTVQHFQKGAGAFSVESPED